MIAGLTGSMLSHDAVSGALDDLRQGMPIANHRWFRRWHREVARELGPASSARQVFDRVAVPLAGELGFRVVPAARTTASSAAIHAVLQADHSSVVSLLVTAWGRDAAAEWRAAVRSGIAHGLRWCICITGPLLRILDASQTYSRRFAEFDLEIASHDDQSLDVLWTLLNRHAFNGDEPTLNRAVALSDRHRVEVRTSLQQGVFEALTSMLRAFAVAHPRRTRVDPPAIFDESLIVIYRILFLLFAEARGLVPNWHPVYRDSYTIESLRGPTERSVRPLGLWESLQAIARLAHRGCRAGALSVPAFNGRLFSPTHAPLADSLILDDGAVRDAMLALTTRPRKGGRQRIAYADLGVEQLGGVYERILEYAPDRAADNPGALSLTRVGLRKSTGTFYTPRGVTEFMVRRALAPLVDSATPDEILALRVVDPAMGSGAFLVTACRYLASAYEAALIREGTLSSADVDESARAGFRRVIAQRCLFGVDVNPMAVQLGRLSLWLATLAHDKPLTFLDHHLRVGNSLAGASIDNLFQPTASRRRARPFEHLPLFDLHLPGGDLQRVVGLRRSLADDPDDTIEQVRRKERLLASLQQPDGPLSAWKAVADLWCAPWFDDPARSARRFAHFGPLVDQLLGRACVVPSSIARPLLEHARAIAAEHRFFHWQLEFPEVFHDVNGRTLPKPGFDAVLGNPPWEMLRGKRDFTDGPGLTAFSRYSGAYRWQGDGHANLYQLFLERALSLARPAGRVALVLPSGFAFDHGCSRLRFAVLDRTTVDTYVTVENRDAVFPIHRSLKFLLMATTCAGHTTVVPCRSGVRSPGALDGIPDTGNDNTIALTRSVIERFSGDQRAIPEVRTDADVAILGRTVFLFPALSSPDGWNIRFGRELNATDDRKHFLPRPAPGRVPVLEGKQIQPFAAHIDRADQYITSATARRLLGSTFTRARLAYRDVSSSSNRLTLIAAIVPANAVTTHTLFCLKGNVEADHQLFLCGIFNSFIANYLIRMRVGTHVNVSIVEQLPVPRPPLDSLEFHHIVRLARRVVSTSTDVGAAASVQAAVAHLYQLTTREFEHVLATFPLIPQSAREQAMQCFLEYQETASK